jgi:hypothetical protein
MRKHLLRKALMVLGVVGVLAVPMAAKALDEWGPQNRPTFTMSHPATYVTFNSITDNTQAIGDERHFYTANQTGVANYSHNLPVTDNEEVTLRLYYHNNAAANLNLVAFNTNVKMQLPSTAATDQSTVAFISATNANPTSVWDTVHMTNAQPFTMDYEAGSAKLFNNALNGASLSDNIVTSAGAPIGFDKLDGKVPGCLNFSGYVTIKVKIHVTPPPTTPAFSCDMLNISASEDRTVKITQFNTSASGGASFKNAVLDWGDNSATVTDTNLVGKTHQYDHDGTFVISATAHFNVNGQDKTATSQACAKQVTFAPNQPPQVTPPPSTPGQPGQPTTLVNTGAGSVAGLFAAVTAAGAVAYRWLLARRLSRQ